MVRRANSGAYLMNIGVERKLCVAEKIEEGIAIDSLTSLKHIY